MTKNITFIIPTLNAGSVLNSCLKSVSKQNYKNYQIIIADGGSTDNTLKIAKKYKAQIVKNPLKTAEAGKAVAVKKCTTKFICLLDSDNILPNSKWLKTMMSPFSDPAIIGSEPWAFTYRSSAGFIERYSALIGANDPYAFVVGVSDRINYLKPPKDDHFPYIKLTLNPKQRIPTIGANGTIFKTNFIKKNLKLKYLFDIDIITQVINQTQKPLYFAKVKIGIIHTFCEASISKFVKKQKRRLVDYYQYQTNRQYNWSDSNRLGILKFIFHTIFLSPLFALYGFIKKPDPAWFFHPPACLITLYLYSLITIKHFLGFLKPVSRQNWQQ